MGNIHGEKTQNTWTVKWQSKHSELVSSKQFDEQLDAYRFYNDKCIKGQCVKVVIYKNRGVLATWLKDK